MYPSISRLNESRSAASANLRYRMLQRVLTARQSGNLLDKGFTLVELLVVIVILGILATVGISSYLQTIDTAASGAARAFATEEAKKCTAALVGGFQYAPGTAPERTTTTIAAGSCAADGTFPATGGGTTWTVTLDAQGFPTGPAVRS